MSESSWKIKFKYFCNHSIGVWLNKISFPKKFQRQNLNLNKWILNIILIFEQLHQCLIILWTFFLIYEIITYFFYFDIKSSYFDFNFSIENFSILKIESKRLIFDIKVEKIMYAILMKKNVFSLGMLF